MHIISLLRTTICAMKLAGVLTAAAAARILASESDTFFFVESFDEDVISSGKWVKSKVEKYTNQKVFVKPSHKAASEYESDKGLHLADEMSHYGISTLFKEPFTANGKDVVLQYEVKLEEGLQCGGAYLKFLRDSPALRSDDSTSGYDLSKLNNESPFSIMFGPDNCGVSNNQVHFIMQHRRDTDSPFVEKFYNDTPPVALDTNTHLYTLVLHADNSVEFFVDLQKASDKGSLLVNMDPPVNPPPTVDDPSDVKPADWVDAPTYPDPEAVKPADWDDDAPPKIPSPTAKKPAGWDDTVPVDVPDPDAKKPAEWDDEEDGVWERAMVPNPLCLTTGCGVWEAPMIRNPAYKGGKWKPPMIANPAYKGEWKPRQLPNPDTSRDDKPLDNLAPIIGVAVEVWTTVGGIHLDNIVVARSKENAFEFAERTFVPKQIAEGKAEAEARRLHREQRLKEKWESSNFMGVVEVYLADFSDFLAASQFNMVMMFLLALGCVTFSSYLLMGWEDEKKPAKKDDSETSADAAAAGDKDTKKDR